MIKTKKWKSGVLVWYGAGEYTYHQMALLLLLSYVPNVVLIVYGLGRWSSFICNLNLKETLKESDNDWNLN